MQSDAYKFGPDTKTTLMVWTCDATWRDAHNKKKTTYDSDGNPTPRTAKNEMARQTEKWHAHLWHQPRDGHWQKTLGSHGEKRRHHPDGRRRKRLVTLVCFIPFNSAIPCLWLHDQRRIGCGATVWWCSVPPDHYELYDVQSNWFSIIVRQNSGWTPSSCDSHLWIIQVVRAYLKTITYRTMPIATIITYILCTMRIVISIWQ